MDYDKMRSCWSGAGTQNKSLVWHLSQTLIHNLRLQAAVNLWDDFKATTLVFSLSTYIIGFERFEVCCCVYVAGNRSVADVNCHEFLNCIYLTVLLLMHLQPLQQCSKPLHCLSHSVFRLNLFLSWQHWLELWYNCTSTVLTKWSVVQC